MGALFFSFCSESSFSDTFSAGPSSSEVVVLFSKDTFSPSEGFPCAFSDAESTKMLGRCHGSPVLGCFAMPNLTKKEVGSLALVRLHLRTGFPKACAADIAISL